MYRKGVAGWVVSSLIWAALPGAAAPRKDFNEMTLEELLRLDVTSVSKTEEPRFDAAAALYVITSEDLRRQGVRSIPEALRMVPGLEVARVSANRWAVSARGFNGLFSNKLLVLIDGRSVYDPSFGGVFWDARDVMIEDVDRIEVIRGPGGAVWGANATNGIINVVTKKARDTQGGLAVVGGGNEEGFGAFRYGGGNGRGVSYRVYAKYDDYDGFVTAAGTDAKDQWDRWLTGFRVDWDHALGGDLRVEGSYLESALRDRVSVTAPPPRFVDSAPFDAEARNGNLLARWSKDSLSAQVYYDRSQRTEKVGGEHRDTFDLELQQNLSPASRHDVSWGLGARRIRNEFSPTFAVSWEPLKRDDDLYVLFAQDRVRFGGGRTQLIVGSKLEHTDRNGFEAQPSIRLTHKPSGRQVLWAAVSRAVRTPSRVNYDLRSVAAVLPTPGLPTYVVASGSHDIDSEKLVAAELGYRIQPTQTSLIDVALFHHDYEDLIENVPAGQPFVVFSPPPPHVVVPLVAVNRATAESYGVEVATDFRLTRAWQIAANYSYLNLKVRDTTDKGLLALPGTSPRHQVKVLSRLDLPRSVELDLGLYWVDDLPSFGLADHLRADLRLGWRPRPAWELAIGARDLLKSQHQEFGSDVFFAASEVERSVYGSVALHF